MILFIIPMTIMTICLIIAAFIDTFIDTRIDNFLSIHKVKTYGRRMESFKAYINYHKENNTRPVLIYIRRALIFTPALFIILFTSIIRL